MQKVFFKIRSIQLELTENITIHIGKLEPVKNGWVVKLKKWQNFEGEDGMHQALEIAARTTETVSGYKDGDVELWDVVEIIENELEATKLGKANGQMSIYQIETARLKWI